MKQLRQALTPEEISKKSETVFRMFVESKKILPKNYKKVAFYFPIHGEVDTRPFFELATKAKKKCLMPRVAGQSLNFYEVQHFSELSPGTYGIFEPKRGLRKPLVPDVVFVPAIAYSKNFERLGFGGGYYDRTIHRWKSNQRKIPLLIGLAYDFQLVEKLPNDKADLPVDIIITESKVYARQKKIRSR